MGLRFCKSLKRKGLTGTDSLGLYVLGLKTFLGLKVLIRFIILIDKNAGEVI